MIAEERTVVERVEPAMNAISAPSHKTDEPHQMKEKSVYKGVFKCGKKYKAQIQTNRVQHYLGLFDTEIEAARAYDNHARVVLGPKARTNFEYPTSNASEPAILVAPLFVRQDGRNASDGSHEPTGTTAPKRSYVGIKMKRRESSEKKARLDDMESHPYMQQYGGHLGGGAFGHMGNGLSSLDSLHNSFAEGNGNFNMKSLGNMSEDQYRWYEQFQQMQQIQQHQQFLMQFGASLPGQFNPFAAASSSFLQNMNTDHYPAFGGAQMPLPMGNTGVPPSQYGSFPYDAFMAQQGLQYPGAKTGPFAHLASRTPELPQPASASAFGARGVTPPAPLKAPTYAFPGAQPSAVGGAAGPAAGVSRPRPRDMPRDQSTLAAAAQLGQLMGLPAQPLLEPADMDKSLEVNTVAATTTAAAAETVHKTVSPVSSSNPSRRGSLATDDGTKILFDTSKPPTYALPASVPSSLQARLNQLAPPAAPATIAEETTLEDEEEEEEELDWRDQLYYWTGILYYDPARAVQVWKGSWVGSYSGKPMSEEFSWSFNHFEYTLDGGRATPMMGAENTLLPQSGPMQGYYLMDNDGSGALQKYVDTEYTVEFEQLPNLVGGGVSELFAVYGRGDSDFGEFVVTGNYNKRTRILEMTRQYIAETDARSKMPLPQLKALMRHQR